MQSGVGGSQPAPSAEGPGVLRPDPDALVAIQELSRCLADAEDLKDVGRLVTQMLLEAAGAVAASLSVLSAPEVLELVDIRGDTPGLSGLGRRFPLALASPVTDAVRTGQVVSVTGRDDVNAAYPMLFAGVDERSVAALPLFTGGECVGAVGFMFNTAAIADTVWWLLGVAMPAIAQAVARLSAREAEQDRYVQMAFLAAATAELAGSLDYERTLQRLADLVVPEIANWCAIDLLDDGVLRPVAVAHADPSKVALALRMRQDYPPDPAAATGAHAVARTGVPELWADVPPELLEAAAHDAEHLRLVQELDLRSAIAVPLHVHDRTLGVLTLVRSGDSRRYSSSDLRFAEELASRAAVAIDNAQVHSETLEASLQLQRAVLPASFAGLPDWQVAVHYRPAGHTAVGGDFYDALPLTDGRLVAFVGDVMGRGVAAAAAMAQVRSALRAYVALDPDPRTVIERLAVMFDSLDLPQLVTVLYAVLDPIAGTVALLSAGHLPPFVVRLDGTADRLEVPSSPPLGAGQHHRDVVTVALAAGETLLLFTDGLVERRGEDLDAGLDRLLHVSEMLHGEVTDTRLRLIADELRQAGHDDDVTLLAVRSTGLRLGLSS